MPHTLSKSYARTSYIRASKRELSAMFSVASIHDEEPPSTRTAQLAEKTSRLLLMILCVSPIALFPVALAVRAYGYFFP